MLQDVMIAVKKLTKDRDELWLTTYLLPHFPKAGKAFLFTVISKYLNNNNNNYF